MLCAVYRRHREAFDFAVANIHLIERTVRHERPLAIFRDAERAVGAFDACRCEKAKDLRESTYRNVEESLRLSWSALDLTVQQKEFLSDHVDSASDTVISYEKQYRIGKRTLLDLLNTENELFEARKGYLDAKYDEQYAKYRVMNATGNLLTGLRVDIPQEWNEKVEY